MVAVRVLRWSNRCAPCTVRSHELAPHSAVAPVRHSNRCDPRGRRTARRRADDGRRPAAGHARRVRRGGRPAPVDHRVVPLRVRPARAAGVGRLERAARAVAAAWRRARGGAGRQRADDRQLGALLRGDPAHVDRRGHRGVPRAAAVGVAVRRLVAARAGVETAGGEANGVSERRASHPGDYTSWLRWAAARRRDCDDGSLECRTTCSATRSSIVGSSVC